MDDLRGFDLTPAASQTTRRPDYVAPMAIALAHESVPCTGQIFQAGGGWFSQVTWQRSNGLSLEIGGDKKLTPEALVAGWDKVTSIPAPNGVPQQFGGTHADQQMTQVLRLLSEQKSKM